ncbi:MAG TPA: transglutaminase domain-containing protein [Terriglobales bacterium]|nr:transglutaminase domain-containing protein [Terriglobales bacterium]
MNLKYVLHLLPAAAVTKQTSNATEQITISNGTMNPVESVSYAPSDAVIYPQVEFASGNSWHEVAQTYSEAVSRRVSQSALALTLPQSASRDETISALVSLLHKRVRYTGVEFGESQLIPEPPSETLKRGYGDCKDKSSLLVAMLKSRGIPAYLALLETGPGQDLNPELPGMGTFDHAIVYVPGKSDLWIDATAEYTRAGNLPVDDQGRLALIVKSGTTALVKTPESAASDNLLVEQREIHLSDYGSASITETSFPHGNVEENYRSYYTADKKKERQKELEAYVKSVYLADSLSQFQTNNDENLREPFQLRLEAKDCRRATTALSDAAVGIQQGYITDRLPEYFSKEVDKHATEQAPQRNIDWAITPFITEWHYKIFLPAGFTIRSLPADSEQQLGPAKFTEKFKASSDGTVEVLLRFNTVKSRFTPEEAAALRDANVKLRNSEMLLLSFDHAGHALMSSGKIAEGLAIYQDIVSQHPTSALDKVRFADALLSAGLGEKARTVARSAVQQDPKSVVAYSTLAWILQHDLISRRFKTGFDYEGALGAYRQALVLDPKKEAIRENYAILLEHDKWGKRYTPQAHLEDAIQELRNLKDYNENAFKQYEDNILYDDFYAGHYQDLLNEASGLPKTNARRHLMVAASTALKGAAAGKEYAASITDSDQSRNETLVGAGQLLFRVRLYTEGADLLAAGSQGQSESQTTLAQINAFVRTKRIEGMHFDDADPTTVIRRMAREWFSLDADENNFMDLLSKNALDRSSKESVKKLGNDLRKLHALVLNSELPANVFLDLLMSNMKLTAEGNDEQGYRITMTSLNAKTQYAYVVKENGRYKVLASGDDLPEIGREVLDRLQHGDQKSARVMLDFARDRQTLGGGDDPLEGRVFPRFWMKGQNGDEQAMHSAALSLIVDDDSVKDYIQALERDSAQSAGDQKTNFDLALAHAYRKLQRWKDLRLVAQRLLKSFPSSDVAFSFFEASCQQQKQWKDCEAAIQARLARDADDLPAKRVAAQDDVLQGHIDAAFDAWRHIAADGLATTTDLNQFAWTALFIGSVPEDAIEAAQRANGLTQNRNYAILHTLACLYAEVGKTNEARELLVRAMETNQLAEPDSDIWFGFGRVAEAYGQYDAAEIDYKRVEEPNIADPVSTYTLSQLRLQELTKSHPELAKIRDSATHHVSN